MNNKCYFDWLNRVYMIQKRLVEALNLPIGINEPVDSSVSNAYIALPKLAFSAKNKLTLNGEIILTEKFNTRQLDEIPRIYLQAYHAYLSLREIWNHKLQIEDPQILKSESDNAYVAVITFKEDIE